jgi:penicillin-binding protein 1A
MPDFRADQKDPVRAARRKKAFIVGTAVTTALLAVGLAVSLIWSALFRDLPKLPDAETLWTIGREPAVEFADRSGQVIGIRGPRYGRAVTLDALPPYVPAAFLAIEDRRFFERDSIDETAIARAAAANWRAGRTVQGGSTITQQTLKILLLTPERTIRRKAQELRLAGPLEAMLGKRGVLELYLNRIFFGEQAYGIDAAAQRYFAKPAAELTLSQAALLAGLPQSPSRNAPTRNLAAAIERRDLVLSQMLEGGFITQGDYEAAMAETIEIAPFAPGDPLYGHVIDLALSEAANLVETLPPDAVITLTVDPVLQASAHETLNTVLSAEGTAKRVGEGAIVLIEPRGAIRALIGGRDYAASQFNRASQSRRPSGSTFKVFVYAAALEAGRVPYDVRVDKPITIRDWSPKNYGGGFIGPVTLSEAFALSINTIAVQLVQEVGPGKLVEVARRFGIASPLDPVPALALGAGGVSLVELTGAFGPFATGGYKTRPYIIEKITDSRGKLLYEYSPPVPERVYREDLTAAMVSMMARVVRSGTGQAGRLEGRDIAAKTGTSQDWRDAWFVGVSADWLGGVWVGNDDNAPMRRVTGGDIPARIWKAVMVEAHRDRPPRPLPGANETLNPAQEERVAFYRELSGLFSGVQSTVGSQVAARD